MKYKYEIQIWKKDEEKFCSGQFNTPSDPAFVYTLDQCSKLRAQPTWTIIKTYRLPSTPRPRNLFPSSACPNHATCGWNSRRNNPMAIRPCQLHSSGWRWSMFPLVESIRPNVLVLPPWRFECPPNCGVEERGERGGGENNSGSCQEVESGSKVVWKWFESSLKVVWKWFESGSKTSDNKKSSSKVVWKWFESSSKTSDNKKSSSKVVWK